MDRIKALLLVADPHRMVAEALMDALLEAGNVEGQIATSYSEALLVAQLSQPDLVLADAWIGPASVEEMVRELKARAPHSKLFVMATQVDASLERRAVGAGASGWYQKDRVPAAARDLIAAVGRAQ